MFLKSIKFLFIIILLSCLTVAEKGQASTIKDELKQTMRLSKPKVKVTQVITGDTFIINNNETIHLPAIYIPVSDPREAGKSMQTAKKLLEELILNRYVNIYQVRNQNRGQYNALGHMEGYVVREDGLFIQAEMVAQGIAFAYPTQSHFDMAEKLYQSEMTARENNLGLWAEKEWAILDENQAKNAQMDKFKIVEGVIERVISRNNIIYMNFDRDWRDDFTISADSQLRREFSKHNINLMQLDGQLVRVRGWMREYNGPYIEIFHPSQLELIDEVSNTKDTVVESLEIKTSKEDTIEDRIKPNSAMFSNPTIYTDPANEK